MVANLYKVVIVGRTNVGKSALFNRLISEKKAIVSDESGTTRDRNYALCSWRDLDFYLIDTGGLVAKPTNEIDQQVSQQTITAIKDADLILLMVDVKVGLTAADRMLAKTINQYPTAKILVINKVDNNKWRHNAPEFYKLNMDEPALISAANGIGTGDLLDMVVASLKSGKNKKTKTSPAEETKGIRVAIVGRPNVGKSSLINALIGEPRLIVSALPHTTRDSQDIELSYEKHKIILVDTAGIRRYSKKSSDDFEHLSVEQSLKSIHRADITILVTDVSEKLSWQDKHMVDEALRARTGLVIIGNKWDLITAKDTAEFTRYYRRFFAFAQWAPVVFISATRHLKIKNMLDMILSIYQEKNRLITDNALSKLLKETIKRHRPTRGAGTKHPYLHNLKQTRVNPPEFMLKINFKAILHESYLKFIENNLRYKFGFSGVPIRIRVQKSQNLQDK